MLKFAIDIDGVARDILSQMVEIYNERFGESVSVSDVTEYDMKGCFQKIKDPCKYFFIDNPKEVFYDAKPFPKAIEAIKKLKETGFVSLVTKQTTPKAMQHTIDWVYMNGVPFDSICFTGNDKSHVVDGFDWFVDDYPVNLENCGTPNKVLVDAPYNKSYDIKNLKADGKTIRVASLFEFACFFDKRR